MLPEVAFVEVNASVTVVLEPAVTVAGVAVNVAVGAGDELPLLPEEEPPQLASTTQNTKTNAKDQTRRRSSSQKILMISAAFTPISSCALAPAGGYINLLLETREGAETVPPSYQNCTASDSHNGSGEITPSCGDLSHPDGGPGRSRTADQRFRKPLLYPTELRGHVQLILSDVSNFDNPIALRAVRQF
jgi:hypothetical protein